MLLCKREYTPIKTIINFRFSLFDKDTEEHIAIDLLDQVKEALSEINKDEKQQTKIDCYYKKNE
jgi:hypothetical protein